MSPPSNKTHCKINRKTSSTYSKYKATRNSFEHSNIKNILVAMIKLFQYQIAQLLKQDPEMIQVLEWSEEKLHRILLGKFQCTQIQFIDTLLNK